jgi:hypothetical protein
LVLFKINENFNDVSINEQAFSLVVISNFFNQPVITFYLPYVDVDAGGIKSKFISLFFLK